MIYPHNTELAQLYADKVIARLKQENLAATPNNFELWYVYYSADNEDVTNAIDATLQKKKKINEKECFEIYSNFLNDRHTEERVRQAGDDLRGTITNVKNVVAGVKSSTHQYQSSLEKIRGKLSANISPKDFSVVVDEVRGSTDKIITHNKNLEAILEDSAHEIEKLRSDLEKVRKESLTDSLTGLANRKYFDAEMKRIIDEYQIDRQPFSLLMLDIDHFKSFNDNFGHQVGDQVLRLVARCFKDGIKGQDISARYGGEEFVIILPGTELEASVAVANNLRKIVANKDVVNRNTGERLARITISVGTAQYNGTESIEELISRADSALYTAKNNGRNQVAAAPAPVRKMA